MHSNKVKRFNIPGHAHELTFSCHHKNDYFVDERLCRIFLDELIFAKERHCFRVWAYVLMPSHVHLLIWPKENGYDISAILKELKGRTSRRYSLLLQAEDCSRYQTMLKENKTDKLFALWQRGPGYDRNISISRDGLVAIRYIEQNPVRAGLVGSETDYVWSSAYARKNNCFVIPDTFQI